MHRIPGNKTRCEVDIIARHTEVRLSSLVGASQMRVVWAARVLEELRP